MHETDMTKALIMTIKDWTESQPQASHIEKVHLVVGKFTCVEPSSLKFSFQAQTRDTFLAGVELVIKDIPLVAFCHHCEQEYQPEIGLQYGCPDCKSPMEDIRSGRELKIAHIEYSTTNERREKQPLIPASNQ